MAPSQDPHSARTPRAFQDILRIGDRANQRFAAHTAPGVADGRLSQADRSFLQQGGPVEDEGDGGGGGLLGDDVHEETAVRRDGVLLFVGASKLSPTARDARLKKGRRSAGFERLAF